MSTQETATCRGCGRKLDGKPFYMGGNARIPETGKQAKKNFYGGYVCSYQCDFRSSLELEQSMPGHDCTQKRLGCFAQERLDANWRDER